MLVGLIVLLALLGFIIFLLAHSPGKLKPWLDEAGQELHGSISEVIKLQIGGIEQGMILRGKNIENPVVLFLHGGPGSPEYMMTQRHPLPLDEFATICWWEQRGAGMSYHSDIPEESMTLQQMVEDTAEVARYLCNRFGKTKVFLMGHSWGTFLGMHTARQYPELFHAYIGIGQIKEQFTSERLAYDYMLEQLHKTGDHRLEKKLREHKLETIADLDSRYIGGVRTQGMNKLGIGMVHQKCSLLKEALFPLFLCPAYTLKQKLTYPMGLAFSQKHLWNSVICADLGREVPKLDLPVHILHGRHDYQVSYQLSLAYFDLLQAPQKTFYTFEQSAHSPLFEEPERFIQIMREQVLSMVPSPNVTESV